jgi:hypothetical protein
MSINLTFHGTQKCDVKKNVVGNSVWYVVAFYMDNYRGGHDKSEVTVFLQTGTESLSPFEEMWQEQEAARLAKEMWASGEKVESMLTDDDGPADPLPASDFGTDPDLAAELEEGTSALEQEPSNASR